MKDYVIAVSGPEPCWLSLASDEQESKKLVTTADISLALRFSTFVAGRAALRQSVKRHPSRSFRLDVVERL